MLKVGILARMEAKPGKEDEVAAFLEGALALVQQEPDTVTWYAIRIGQSEFGIFDTFEEDAGRQAHLSGKVAEALMARAPELFTDSPDIQHVFSASPNRVIEFTFDSLEDAGKYFDRKEISRILQGELTAHGTNVGLKILTRLADYSKDTVTGDAPRGSPPKG